MILLLIITLQTNKRFKNIVFSYDTLDLQVVESMKFIKRARILLQTISNRGAAKTSRSNKRNGESMSYEKCNYLIIAATEKRYRKETFENKVVKYLGSPLRSLLLAHTVNFNKERPDPVFFLYRDIHPDVSKNKSCQFSQNVLLTHCSKLF